jgi:ABC-type sugar transport system ATPase subunit
MRGVDVGTRADIYALMRELAREGLAILVISSDLPEVLTIPDRILVVRAGRLAGEISFDDASEERIMSLASPAICRRLMETKMRFSCESSG